MDKIVLLPETEEKIKALKEQGYTVEFSIEEKNFITTGKYSALYAAIIKDGKIIQRHFSSKSFDNAFYTTYDIFVFMEDWNKRMKEKYG